MRWSFWKRRRSDDDFAAEVESHLSMETDRLARGGMTTDDAHMAARRAFGNPTVAREQFHYSTSRSLEQFVQDVRYGLRGMRRSPAFTVVAVLSLALGIGVNTTMFATIDTLFLQPPAHVREPSTIHRVYFDTPSPNGGTQAWPAQGYRTYTALRDQVRGFESVAAFWPKTISSGHGTDARANDALLVTPSFFRMLGVTPVMGRFFAPDEERDEGEHVAVLGYETWRGSYAADSAALGRTVDVNGVPYVIVGVAPPKFTGVGLTRVDLWLPIGAATRLLNPRALDANGGGYWLEIIAKRRANVTVEQVATEATQAYHDRYRESSRFEETFAKQRAIVGPLIAARGPVPDAGAKVSVWVAAMSVVVLLIACANVANLLLLRGLARSREAALRLSLGASRGRLVRQSLVEGVLLAVVGAACALAVAKWSAAAFHSLLIPTATDTPGVLDARVLAFTVAVALGTGLLAALAPALVTARGDVGPALGASRAGERPGRLPVQRTLIGAQVALATMLLVGAGLFVISLRNVRAIDLGLDVDHLLYVSVDLDQRGTKANDPSGTAARVAYEAILERVRRLPGVRNATLTAGEPLASGWAISLQRRDAPPLKYRDPVPFARAVGRDYFETMGTRLVQGRLFTASDHAPNAHVAIVDEATAKFYWPSGNALDPCVKLGSDSVCTEIVGVVANTVRWQITGEQGLVVYLPIESPFAGRITMMEVRTAGDPTAMITVVRQAVSSVSPDMPWADIQPVSERLAPQLRPWRLGASMFTAFGALALGLAAIGLYGLVSYVVAQRTQEIGIRKALGAPDGGMVRMVIGRALTMTVAGVAIGIPMALAASRLVSTQLYGVSARDPAVYVTCAGVLVLVAVVASLVPARRAMRVDPVVALKTD